MRIIELLDLPLHLSKIVNTTRVAGVPPGIANGRNKEEQESDDEYADNTRKWQRAESEDVLVFWQAGLPDDIGPDVMDAVKKNRPVYYKNWGRLLNYRPRVIVYADYKPWSEWRPKVGVSAGGIRRAGETSAGWGGTVQVYSAHPNLDVLASGTVLHEIGHLYQFQNGGTFVAYCWLYEGDATYHEVAQEYDYLARAQDIAAAGELPTLQGSGPSCDGANAREAYDIGYSFFKYLEETFGPDAHLRLWKLIGQGKTVKDALQQITDMDFTEMETDFRTWLGAPNVEPPTVVPTNEFTFPPTPTYEGGGATPKP